MFSAAAHISQSIYIKDVEAVEFFLLPLPAPYNISRFRVCFHFQPLSSKCFRFHKKFNSFHRFRFHIPAPCFMKNASQKVKCLKKSNASEFASAFSFFLQSTSTKIYFQLPLPVFAFTSLIYITINSPTLDKRLKNYRYH